MLDQPSPCDNWLDPLTLTDKDGGGEREKGVGTQKRQGDKNGKEQRDTRVSLLQEMGWDHQTKGRGGGVRMGQEAGE